MSNVPDRFPPTRAAAQDRLTAFAPHAGREYAARRNFDQGAGNHNNVSTLSPYLRMRVLDEISVSRAVLDHYAPPAADKFLAEVFWRTYWKGWLELRPSVWDNYQIDLRGLQNAVTTQAGLRHNWKAACLGETGIAPFDHWAGELVQTGYLHNHARMWFASIWIFTLGLPWQLGADFFLRHLLDGDAAVNTLSWRWVAGIQTKGKTYLADAQNIATFTEGRFAPVEGLAQTAEPRTAPDPPSPRALPTLPEIALPRRYGILLHSDDIDLPRILQKAPDPVSCVFADASAGQTPWQMSPQVSAFRKALAHDMLGAAEQNEPLDTITGISEWATAQRLDGIVTPYAPIGPMQQMLDGYAQSPGAKPIVQLRRPLDSAAWPLATKGFFPFRKHIPKLLADFVML